MMYFFLFILSIFFLPFQVFAAENNVVSKLNNQLQLCDYMPDKSLSFYMTNKQIEECYLSVGNEIIKLFYNQNNNMQNNFNNFVTTIKESYLNAIDIRLPNEKEKLLASYTLQSIKKYLHHLLAVIK